VTSASLLMNVTRIDGKETQEIENVALSDAIK
jgi:hypothetical protein